MMHGYNIPLKEMTKEERKAILKGLIDKYADNIEKQRETIRKIDDELIKKRKNIVAQQEKLKHYRHMLSKVV
jgi:ribosome recycling factor